MSQARFGIAFRLNAGLAAVVLLMLAALAISLVSFERFRVQLDDVGTRQVPALTAAGQLRQTSDAILAAARSLAAGASASDLDRDMQELSVHIATLRQQLDRLERHGLEADEHSGLVRLTGLFERNVAELHRLGEARIELDGRRADLLGRVAATERGLAGFAGDGPLPPWGVALEAAAEAVRAMLLGRDDRFLAAAAQRHAIQIERARQAIAALPPGSRAGPERLVAGLADGLDLDRLRADQELRMGLADAAAATLAEVAGQAGRFGVAADGVFARVRGRVLEASAASAAEVDIVNLYLLLSGIAAVLGAFAVGVFVNRSAARRLRELERAMTAHAAGEKVPVPHSGSDEIGQMARAFGFFVEEIGRREAEIRSSRAFYQALIERSAEGMSIVSADGVSLYESPSNQRIVGYPREELQGRRFDELIHPDDRRKAMLAFQNLAREPGSVGSLEFRFRHRSGRWRYIYCSLRNALDNPDINGVITNFRDMTEDRLRAEELRMARDEAEQSARTKSEFLANMSHEIRTPMNAIIGMTHLALKTDLTPRQQDYLGKISAAAQALLRIINDILDYSKIEAGHLDLERTTFRLDGVLEDLSSLMSLRAEEKGLELFFRVAQDVPGQLVGDSLRLGQILVNLVGNAVKFTERGEIVVSVEVAERDDEHATLRFAVRDTGIGMAPEQLPRMFDSFSQADGSTTRKYGGTGLGLAICKRLVGLMGGEIGVDSEVGRGTRFTFTARFGLLESQAERPADRGVDLSHLRVLVADDNATARDVLGDMLRGADFEVAAVASGEAAIAEVRRAIEAGERPYDLVLMDWRMPGIDGVAAADRIKTDRTLPRAPVVLMVTAHGRDDVMREAEAVGVDGFLVKPVNASVLMDTLARVFTGGSTAPPPRRAPERPARGDSPVAGARVLLAEDNLINQQIARELLLGAGCEVTLANNGLEAVEAVAAGDYDLVLMDVQMPEMDGHEATRRLRTDPRNAALPVIALTAHAMSGDRERSLAAGMNDHLSKPIDPDALVDMLEKWLSGRPPRAAAPPEAGDDDDDDDSDADGDGQLPGIDVSDALRRVQGNHALLQKLFHEFSRATSNAVSTIRQASEAGDLRTAERLAHTLKGTAGSLGMSRVQAAAASVEAAARAGSRAEIDGRLDDLGPALDEVLDGLQRLQEQQPSPAAP